MSAVGTILLQSPGWNEGEARYETLGIHRQKRIELLQERSSQRACGLWLCICWESAAPKGAL